MLKTPVKVNEARHRRMEQAAAAMKRKLAFEGPLAKRIVTRAGARALVDETPDTTLMIDDDESTILYTPDCPHYAGASDHLKEVDAQQRSRDDYQ